MGGLLSLSIGEIVARGAIDDGDISRLRQIFYRDGILSPYEADLIFKLHDACADTPPAWPGLFIEAMTDFIVFQEQPQGYMTARNAEWLIDKVSRDGVVKSKIELELVVNVLDKARWSPVSLVKFAIKQVKHAVISGAGPLRDGKVPFPGAISDGEVELLRRIVYAFGGDGRVAVTREEANILFDIDEAITAAKPNPAWTEFFVKAVANVIMAASGYAVPSREEALRRDACIEDIEYPMTTTELLLAMVRENLESVKDAYHDQSIEERALARLEHQRIEIITHEEIMEAEAAWLVGRLGRADGLSPNEMALVSYLKDASPKIHPTLVEAVGRLGDAA
jgi:hypothetical protein